jgi:hypothetical protein
VGPGEYFTDEYGRTWRFADRSGSKDPYNVDVFKGATGGIAHQKMLSWIGEQGPEAVIPLTRTPRALSLLDKASEALGVSTTGCRIAQTAIEDMMANGPAVDHHQAHLHLAVARLALTTPRRGFSVVQRLQPLGHEKLAVIRSSFSLLSLRAESLSSYAVERACSQCSPSCVRGDALRK